MSDLASEINLIMNYFGMVDQCQNLAGHGYSTAMTLGGMQLIEKEVMNVISFERSRELFDQLEKIYFPSRRECS